jgi:hypothetical protein
VPRRRGERWTMVIEGLGDETTAVTEIDWGCHHVLILQAQLSKRRSKIASCWDRKACIADMHMVAGTGWNGTGNMGWAERGCKVSFENAHRIRTESIMIHQALQEWTLKSTKTRSTFLSPRRGLYRLLHMSCAVEPNWINQLNYPDARK